MLTMYMLGDDEFVCFDIDHAQFYIQVYEAGKKIKSVPVSYECVQTLIMIESTKKGSTS